MSETATTEVKASLMNYRVSAQKARLVVNQIRGKGVEEALNLLSLSPKRVSAPIEKLIRSAVANAVNNNGGDETQLIVKSAKADQGPTMKRFRPRAQGRAFKILKPTSHITIIVG